MSVYTDSGEPLRCPRSALRDGDVQKRLKNVRERLGIDKAVKRASSARKSEAWA